MNCGDSDADPMTLPMPGEVPISTLTRCKSGETRVELTIVVAEFVSDLILAKVGVMGNVFATEEVTASGWWIIPGGCFGLSREDERADVASRPLDFLCEALCCEADALGMFAAVHVSVTGNNSLLTFVTPPEVMMGAAVRLGGAGGGAGPATAAFFVLFLATYGWMGTTGRCGFFLTGSGSLPKAAASLADLFK